MKKRILVLLLVLTFTLFATSTAFAVVQEEPTELKEGEMGITSVEGEQVAPDQPVSNQPEDLKRSNGATDQPEILKTEAEDGATSEPASDGATEEDVRVIMAPADNGVPEMAQTGVIEETKKDNTNIYLATAAALLGMTGFVWFQKRNSN